MQSVVDRNVVMRRMTVNTHSTTVLAAELPLPAFLLHQFVARHIPVTVLVLVLLSAHSLVNN